MAPGASRAPPYAGGTDPLLEGKPLQALSSVLSGIASRRHRDPRGRFADEISKLRPGGSFRIGNVEVRHDPPGSGRRRSAPPHFTVKTHLGVGVAGNDHALGRGEALRKALDASARDPHPEALGGRKVYSGERNAGLDHQGEGRLPEEKLAAAVGDGPWAAGIDENIRKMAGQTADPKTGAVAVDTETIHRKGGRTGDWTPERKQLHFRILKLLTEGAKPVGKGETPEALFMAGGPAAGKSTVLRDGTVKAPAGSVEINPDVIKEMLPEYRALVEAHDPQAASKVHEESSHLAKELMKVARARRYPMVIDKVGGGVPGAYLGQIRAVETAGYRPRVVYVATDVNNAWEGAKARGEATGRKLTEGFVRQAHTEVAQRFAGDVRTSGLPTEIYFRHPGKKGRLSRIYKDGKVEDAKRFQGFLAQ